MENDFRLKIMQIGFASNQNLKQPLKNERRNEKKAQCRNTNTKGKKLIIYENSVLKSIMRQVFPKMHANRLN
jgi:hypothetical protein